MTCIKMGSDESHFNVSLIVRDKVHSVPKPQLLKRKESRSGIERPRSFRLPACRLTARPNRALHFTSVNVLLPVNPRINRNPPSRVSPPLPPSTVSAAASGNSTERDLGSNPLSCGLCETLSWLCPSHLPCIKMDTVLCLCPSHLPCIKMDTVLWLCPSITLTVH